MTLFMSGCRKFTFAIGKLKQIFLHELSWKYRSNSFCDGSVTILWWTRYFVTGRLIEKSERTMWVTKQWKIFFSITISLTTDDAEKRAIIPFKWIVWPDGVKCGEICSNQINTDPPIRDLPPSNPDPNPCGTPRGGAHLNHSRGELHSYDKIQSYGDVHLIKPNISSLHGNNGLLLFKLIKWPCWPCTTVFRERFTSVNWKILIILNIYLLQILPWSNTVWKQ